VFLTRVLFHCVKVEACGYLIFEGTKLHAPTSAVRKEQRATTHVQAVSAATREILHYCYHGMGTAKSRHHLLGKEYGRHLGCGAQPSELEWKAQRCNSSQRGYGTPELNATLTRESASPGRGESASTGREADRGRNTVREGIERGLLARTQVQHRMPLVVAVDACVCAGYGICQVFALGHRTPPYVPPTPGTGTGHHCTTLWGQAGYRVAQ
jgi:hypothetical protein